MQLRYDPLFRNLDTAGDGSGTKNATGNYASDTPFYITPGWARHRFIIHRVLYYIEDDAIGIDLSTYGGITALTTGVLVRVTRKDGTVFDLTDGVPIKTNGDIARICYDLDISTFPANNNYVIGRWTFAKSGAPIVLNFGDRLEFVMRDNLTTLVAHYFMVQGYIEQK
jgi:hypothetical protein